MNKKSTLGVLVSANVGSSSSFSNTRINIATKPQLLTDSILLATNSANSETDQFTYNLNYRFIGDNNTTLNIDLDHGEYGTERTRFQPNTYFNAGEEEVLSEVINSFETPSDISISTAKIDYEFAGLGGTLGVGSKLSRVASDNTFLFNNVVDDRVIQNDFKSNIFKYDERVYAGYLSYIRSLSEKVSLSMGLRAEQTDADGDLQTFVEGLSEPPVELNYLSWFLMRV